MRLSRPVQTAHASESVWLDDFFAVYYARRPINATFIGVHELDHMLPDFSENGAGDAVTEMKHLLASASRLEPSDPTTWLDVELARGFLEIQLWEYASAHFHRGNPSTYTGEAVFGLIGLFLTEYAAFAERVAAAMQRMAAIPAFLSQAREQIADAPRVWTDRACRECRGAVALLREGLPMLADERGIQDPAFALMCSDAASAFEDFRAWLTNLPSSPAGRVAAGEEALALYLARGHFLDTTADEIVAYAEEELMRADGLLRSCAAELGGTHGSVLASLADLHPSLEDYQGSYQRIWDQMRGLAEEQGLLTWPESPIRYVPRPAWTRAAAPDLYFLFYRSPAAFHRPAGHDYLVTPIDASLPWDRQQELLRSHHDAVIKLNHVVHHGGIGHHVQNWHASRARSRIGQVAGVDCAARIAMFCGGTMAEGWACYATDLIGQAGGLTPLERCAEHQSRRRMCARSVVDVRLHQGRMTLEEAVSYYRQKSDMPEPAARAEAVRNSMFPGTAVMYLMGTDAIHSLRTDLAARQGEQFSLQKFHDEFLSYGSVPVSLIAADMKRNARREDAHAE